VSLAATERARAWCAYLTPHARRLYAALTDTTRLAAVALGERIQRGALSSPFTARMIRRRDWAGLTDPETIGLALETLADLGWVRPLDVPATIKGGRPTTEFYLHPALSRG
jgi:putative DNA primase/helicase